MTASVVVPGGPADAEALFYAPGRRAAWVDGFAHVVSLRGPWPEPGSALTWRSPPGGRGPVREKIVARTPGGGSTIEIEDERLSGVELVAFAPAGDGTRVSLSLEYRLKDHTPLTPVIDHFVRRSLREGLRRSPARFARERAADLELR